MTMLRAIVCTLALGINSGVAFQAPGRLSAWSRTTTLKSTNDAFANPDTFMDVEAQNPSQSSQIFGGTFASAREEPMMMSEATRALKKEIDQEKSKGRKDYSQLKQLKSKLQSQAAVDEKAVILQKELEAAEQREDYDRCGELQAQLEGLFMSMQATAPQYAPNNAAPGNQRGQPNQYNQQYNNNNNNNNNMNQQQFNNNN
mmetsp:Transcript_91723/g.262233  ORF Transcript_91723/g.262233 Transcript_91723/m.262233 type:complete len:201 (-) Transcript_91723:4-606(-)